MINPLLQIFKRIISLLLINNFTGKLISKIKRDRLHCYSFVVDTSNPLITSPVKAAIFFNKYESAEYRFIKKYLNNNFDVVELGASLGIISCLIRSKVVKDRRVISVEANPGLIQTINNNILANNLKKNFVLINKAISYKNTETRKTIFTQEQDTLIGRVGTDYKIAEAMGSSWVDIIKLVDIVNEYQIKDYSLVCDIEGSEIEIFLNENECLKDCKQIIIETHNTNYRNTDYTFSELAELITSRYHFKLIDSYGPVYVFNSY